MYLTENLFKLVQAKTITHSLSMLVGTSINGVLGLLFFVFLARSLGPDDFGLFSVCIAVLTLLADIGDFGTNTSLINFVSKYIKDDKEKAFKFMKLALETKLISGLFFLFTGLIFAPFVAEKILLKPEITIPIQLATLGIMFALLFNFVTYNLQAAQRFKSWGAINILANGLRLILLLVSISFLTLNLNLAIIVYIASLLFGVVMGTLFLPMKFLSVKNEFSIANNFFGYSKYVAIFIILAAISSRLDTFISARFVSSTQLGIYSVANQLSSVIPQLVFAIASVIAPKLKGYSEDALAINYLKKVQFFVTGLALAALLFLPIASFLIPVVYGSEYQQSVQLFYILFLSQLLFLLAIPSNQVILYYFEKPNIYCISISLQLMLVAFFGVILISRFGIIGAAYTILLENAFNFIFPGAYVLYQFRRRVR